MYKLLIIESPGKREKIESYLGPTWRVIASLGHIRALEKNIKFITEDFKPEYNWIKEKSKAIKQLKEAASDAEEIYLAADKDMEGEQIAYSVALLLKLNVKTAKRVTFTEITEKAITYAVANPTTIDMNTVYAQQARAMLDMMIGFTMSPLLWRYVAPALSAGRCQTPALRLVVEREDKINTFKASSSWKLTATYKKDEFSFDAIMDDELEDEESAVNYMEQTNQQSEASILSTVIKPWSESAPLPLITSTLQQQASALYGINPKNAMKIAQKLYEAGHITYMRTDKAVLSEDAVKEAMKWVTEQYGEEYVKQTEQTKKKPKVGKKEAMDDKPPCDKKEKIDKPPCGGGPPPQQEAHEAIRPTHLDITEIEGDAYEKKLYKLIWQRAIQSVMSPAKGESNHVTIQIKEDTDFTWTSHWSHTTFEGWKRVGKVAVLEKEESDEETKKSTWDNAIALKEGDIVQWQKMKAEPKETKAQGRFTEATLVRELETYGIGRPSTFASLLSVIQEKSYVETKDIPAKEVNVTEYESIPHKWPAKQKQLVKKVGAEKNKLVPTELGRSVLHFMLQHFEDLFAYDFTAQMEKRLDHISDGSEQWKQILQDMWKLYKDRHEELSKKPTLSTKSVKIKEFANGLKAVQSKKGPILLRELEKKGDTIFFGWPTGIAFEEMTEEQANTFVQETQQKKVDDIIGYHEEQPILKKSGKFGEYIQYKETTIPYQEESLEKTIERLEAKTIGKTNILKQFKEYVIRTGQYGPYIMKTTLKKPQFVSLPKGITVDTLSEKEVEALYKLGQETKKKWSKK